MFLLSHLLMVVLLALTKLWTGQTAVIVLGGLFGISAAVHTNNALTVCETMVDNARLRGTVLAVVNRWRLRECRGTKGGWEWREGGVNGRDGIGDGGMLCLRYLCCTLRCAVWASVQAGQKTATICKIK